MSHRSEGGHDVPLYNIGSVARLAGVPAATLRNWETRYGIPRPMRSSPGGHRLYTAAEAALAQVLAARVAAGIQIGKAAAAVAAERNSPAVLAAALKQAVERLDATAARRILADAAALLPPEEVWSAIIAPTERRLGEHCATTGAGISVEHLASGVVDGWLRGLMAAAPENAGAPLVVVACGPGERHELGSLMFTWTLRMNGLRTAFLGADTPLSALAEARAVPVARVLCVTATMEDSAVTSADALLRLVSDPAPNPSPALAYAGPGFAGAAALHERLAGTATYLGCEMDDAVRAMVALCGMSTPARIV